MVEVKARATVLQFTLDNGGKKHLAREACISESHIYRYIAGRSEPSVSRLVALAYAGGVTVCWLATGDPPKYAGAGAPQLPNRKTVETVITRARTILKRRGIDLEPPVEARLLSNLLELCHRREQLLDESLLDDVIELATLSH